MSIGVYLHIRQNVIGVFGDNFDLLESKCNWDEADGPCDILDEPKIYFSLILQSFAETAKNGLPKVMIKSRSVLSIAAMLNSSASSSPEQSCRCKV